MIVNPPENPKDPSSPLAGRFRGFLPVVVDVETGGFNAATDALLEGCAGSYTAHAALELYAEVFEQAGALDKLEGFASHFGPDFYRLPRHQDQITLVRRPWVVPEQLALDEQSALIPMAAGQTLNWQVVSGPSDNT